MTFDSFPFGLPIRNAISSAGYTTPTPIQGAAIPKILAGQDVMGLAQTGTGKTAAFVLPILERLCAGHRGTLRSLIIAPTRELADQIDENVKQFARGTGLRSMTIYGGASANRQADGLASRPDIVIACPGRLLDFMQQRAIDLSKIEVLVLDEADQMFDMGFFPSIRKIIRALPSKRQTLLFSATMPTEIKSLAMETLKQPAVVQVGSGAPATTVSHWVCNTDQGQKVDLLFEVLKNTSTESVLVFCRTKHRAKRLGQTLNQAGLSATSLQGNLSQPQRQRALGDFRSGKCRILVATDIAARGIDVSSISHVVNYDMPATKEAYTHRIGRTGRAAKTGDAITFVTAEDKSLLRSIERAIGAPIPYKHYEVKRTGRQLQQSAGDEPGHRSWGRASHNRSGHQSGRTFAPRTSGRSDTRRAGLR